MTYYEGMTDESLSYDLSPGKRAYFNSVISESKL